MLKKLATLLLSLAKPPLTLLYKWLLLPILVYGYRGLRLIKKKLSLAFDHIQDRALRILANRYTVYALVIVLSFTVTATNIYASDPSQQIENLGQQSVLSATLQGGEGENVTVEEVAPEGLSVNGDVSYLAGQALSAHDASSDDESYTGSDEGFTLSDDEETDRFESPIANAVRVQPDFETDQQPPTRTKVETHVVQNGETLGQIAVAYGISVQTILSSNGLSGSSIIRPGQSLKILPVDGVAYTVKRGDTLSSIAKKYSADPDEILKENDLADASSLQVGSEIVLPGGHAPATPAPKPPARIVGSVKDLVTPSAAPDRVGTGKLLWPTAARRITQYWRGKLHTGVDIAGPIGTPIYAADDGVVTYAGWNTGGYGNMTIINHGGGVFTRYGHASKLLTKPGQTVKRGDVIALIGSTGHSTGPHLHFEVMLGNQSNRVNPLEWVR